MRPNALARRALALSLVAALAACGNKSALSFTLASSTPADGASDVALNSAVSAVFSSPIAANTLDSASFTLAPSVTGTVAVAGATAVFSHLADLQPNTTYTATIRGTVLSQSGQSLGADQSWSFTTGGSTDDVPPAQVTTLAAGTATSTTIPLTWTAVGNDGTSGTAALYDLRRATGGGCPITANNFSGATRVTTDAPQEAGQLEAVTAPNLVAATSYCFALVVADQAGNRSPLSNVVTATTASGTDSTPPGTVSDLSATADSATRVMLGWTAPGNDGDVGTAASYDLRASSGAGCPLTQANFASAVAIATSAPLAAGGLEQVEATGLAASTTYCFALTATDAAGNTSALSNVASATTFAPAPGTVADLSVVVTSLSAAFTWTAPTHVSNASYTFFFASGACPANPADYDLTNAGFSDGIDGNDAAGTTEHYTQGALSPNSTVCAALSLTDDNGTSELSNLVAVTTGNVVPPDAIGDLAAELDANDGSVIDLSWTATGDHGATGTAAAYQLRYLAHACASDGSFDFDHATTVATGAPHASGTPESLSVAALPQDLEYCFALKVLDDATPPDVSDLSNPADVFLADLRPPSAITDLRLAATSTNESFQLRWSAPGDNASGVASYELLYVAGHCPAHAADFDLNTATSITDGLPLPAAAATTQTATLGGFEPRTEYCLVLRSTDNASNVSNLSNLLDATTGDDLPPSAIVDLNASGQTATSVDLGWTAPGDDQSDVVTVDHYDLRMQVMGGGATDCTAFVFASASHVALSSPPSAPGSIESHTVSGLTPGSNLCFAIESLDAAGNRSDLSNLLFVTL